MPESQCIYTYIFTHTHTYTYMFMYVYVFYRCKYIWIPTRTAHLLTQSVRRPDDDRLKGSKHVAWYNKIVVLDVY